MPTTIAPGQEVILTQWIAAPADRDLDVLDVIAYRARGRHHAALYASTDVQEVGTQRTWRDEDQLKVRYVGGTGGEGDVDVALPEGMRFRVYRGEALVLQLHYLNAYPEPIEASSVFDVKLVDADPAAQVASMFTVTSLAIDVPPGESALTTRCEIQEDVALVTYTNHMHRAGATATARTLRGETSTVLKDDPDWNPAWAYHSNWSAFDPTAGPLVLVPGTVVELTCTWSNDGQETLRFPNEMCMFVAIHTGAADIVCLDGVWSQR